uniref:Uncharacterized protein n=1 Tax=Magnetospirillum gryphiswaldense TaxID=55518 RepID=A4U0I6_9PROT|nr:hypothetical protein MGR_1286 [Magnetospirillum gryphiswaldense MSR-1]
MGIKPLNGSRSHGIAFSQEEVACQSIDRQFLV